MCAMVLGCLSNNINDTIVVDSYTQSSPIEHTDSQDFKLLLELQRRGRISELVRTGGRCTFRAEQFCGTIRLSSKTIIIRPRIESGLPLVRMMFYMLNDVYGGGLSQPKLDILPELQLQESAELLDLIASLLVERIEVIRHEGLNRSYLNLESEEQVLRGRILVQQQIRHNCQRLEFHCSYDELSEDNLYNQILLWALNRLVPVVSNNTLRKQLLEYLPIFGEVSFRQIVSSDFDNLEFNRLNQNYEPAVNLCRLLNANLSVENLPGVAKASAFLIDVNVLFETFVATRLREALLPYSLSVDFQHSRELLLPIQHSYEVPMRPDILIRSTRGSKLALAVLDTKFKRPVERDQAGKLHFNNPDFYQILSYAATLKCRGVLVYPGPSTLLHGEILKWQSRGETKTPIEIFLLDLSTGRLELCSDLIAYLVREFARKLSQ